MPLEEAKMFCNVPEVVNNGDLMQFVVMNNSPVYQGKYQEDEKEYLDEHFKLFKICNRIKLAHNSQVI